ncbi:MAG: hypothetical protein AAF702_38515 [Chloroflexota bacterium]
MNKKEAWHPRRSIRDALLKLILYGLLVSIGILLMIPFLWMLSSFLKDEYEIFQVPTVWIPSNIRWNNYIGVLFYHFPNRLGHGPDAEHPK